MNRQNTANEDLREYAREKGVYLWEIAYKMGIHDTNFSKKLRTVLPIEESSKILYIIDQIAKEKETAI